MSTKTTVEILQNLHKTIPEIKYAPIIYPGSIDSADLPCVITTPKIGQSIPLTSGAQWNQTTREYEVKLFFEPVSNNEYGRSLNDILDLLDRMNDLYWANKILQEGYIEILQWNDSGTISGDFGFNTSAPIIYAGHFYRGFAFDLMILEVKD